MLEALVELKRLGRHDEHLDIGDIVGDAPRDAARQHDLFDHSWEGGGDPLSEQLEFAGASRGHSPLSAG